MKYMIIIISICLLAISACGGNRQGAQDELVVCKQTPLLHLLQEALRRQEKRVKYVRNSAGHITISAITQNDQGEPNILVTPEKLPDCCDSYTIASMMCSRDGEQMTIELKQHSRICGPQLKALLVGTANDWINKLNSAFKQKHKKLLPKHQNSLTSYAPALFRENLSLTTFGFFHLSATPPKSVKAWVEGITAWSKALVPSDDIHFGDILAHKTKLFLVLSPAFLLEFSGADALRLKRAGPWTDQGKLIRLFPAYHSSWASPDDSALTPIVSSLFH